MSYISDNASEVDPELRGSVDFNFFDSPEKVDTSEKMTNGGGNRDENSVGNGVVDKQHGGQGDHKNDGHRHRRRDSRSDDDYSDDSFSDSGSCTSGCSQRSVSDSRSRSRSRSSSPSPRHKNILDAKAAAEPDADELGSHHSRSRHSSYSSRSRSRSRSSSYDNNSRTRSSQYSQSKESLKIELPDADGNSDNDKKKARLRSYSGSESDDSDMTDVSPLNSREPSPSASPRQAVHGSSKEHRSHGGRPPRSPMYKEKGQRRGIGETSTIDREDIDFDLLMQAVIEMDKDRMRSGPSGKKVMFIPPHIRKKIEKNYSFASDKISDIDRENQRLLQEIMRQNQGRGTRGSGNEPTRNQRMSHSAVNRRREQRRVEEENLKILNRLQQVKPSKGLSRNDQIKDYTRQVTYGVPMTGSPSRRPTSGYARSTSNSSWDGDEGAQSLVSYESSPSQKVRPISAKVRPQSGRVRPQSGKMNRPISAKVRASQRPDWDDRW
ncbi:cilia- and flagella-associated protein 97-like isoform X2 [Lineus longissimus]|uniref:cilia- and flagella-associated protein 97-like isoform X2 n=1 Tax=Lineus longissimus TaxID=88925 RepID=UPI002B4CA8B5